MSNLKSVDEILDFAIQNEEEAAEFYRNWASKADNPGMRKSLEGFAREEEGHKKALLGVKSGKKTLDALSKVTDLKISDYVVNVEPNEDMNYQQALILAMKREKAAYKLYSALAEMSEDATLRETFLGLAQEEAKHKLRFETEYDKNVLASRAI